MCIANAAMDKVSEAGQGWSIEVSHCLQPCTRHEATQDVGTILGSSNSLLPGMTGEVRREKMHGFLLLWGLTRDPKLAAHNSASGGGQP